VKPSEDVVLLLKTLYFYAREVFASQVCNNNKTYALLYPGDVIIILFLYFNECKLNYYNSLSLIRSSDVL
jgi:phosphate starvation-inducible membrane PsiE